MIAGTKPLRSMDSQYKYSLVEDESTKARAARPRHWVLVYIPVAILSIILLFGVFSLSSFVHDQTAPNHLLEHAHAPADDDIPHLATWSTTIRLGPYTIPSRDAPDGDSVSVYEPELPLLCDECMITRLRGRLEHADGSVADMDTGVKLHHMISRYRGRVDVVCPDAYPGQRWFATTNPRSLYDWGNHGGRKLGYALTGNHTSDLVMILANRFPVPQTVYFSVTAEFLPLAAALQAGYRHVTPIWLDIGAPACTDNNRPVPASIVDASGSTSVDETTRPFALRMQQAWTATLGGEVVLVGCHAHAGATRVSIEQDGRAVCRCAVGYRDYVGLEGADDRVTGQAVDRLPICWDVGRMVRGALWDVVAEYDFGAHVPDREQDGALANLGGTGLAYVLRDDQEDGM